MFLRDERFSRVMIWAGIPADRCTTEALPSSQGSQIKAQQLFLMKGRREKAADLRGMLKSHNKVVIQSKHWSGADSRAAVETDNQS